MNPVFLCDDGQYGSDREQEARGRLSVFTLAAVCISATGMKAQVWVLVGARSPGWAYYPDIIKGLKWNHLGTCFICFSINCLALISTHCCVSFTVGHTSNRWTWQYILVSVI